MRLSVRADQKLWKKVLVRICQFIKMNCSTRIVPLALNSGRNLKTDT